MGCDARAEGGSHEAPISIHAPTWGATRRSRQSGGNFNPRTHVGCDGYMSRNEVRELISIHAPTWGATVAEFGQRLVLKDFNPRTHVGCDGCGVRPASCSQGFQSTHPRGVRRLRSSASVLFSRISIHAPTWGATVAEFGQRLVLKDFNPRTHVGCDLLYLCGRKTVRFQSTHPRGVRQHFRNKTVSIVTFQSTHPRGVRPDPPVVERPPDQFQSTHPRGVRLHLPY